MRDLQRCTMYMYMYVCTVVHAVRMDVKWFMLRNFATLYVYLKSGVDLCMYSVVFLCLSTAYVST